MSLKNNSTRGLLSRHACMCCGRPFDADGSRILTCGPQVGAREAHLDVRARLVRRLVGIAFLGSIVVGRRVTNRRNRQLIMCEIG